MDEEILNEDEEKDKEKVNKKIKIAADFKGQVKVAAELKGNRKKKKGT